jgi:inositol 1,4,5-triphosphate receptor type 3
MIMGAIGVSSKYCSFLFTLQLFSAIKFVATIKEIVIAFKLRITQLISMVLFLLILIFFYSNISYNFFPGEFNIETDEEEKNICSSLLECTITYFNHGVRSGGGIGDLLSNKEFPSFMYWIRFFNDFIFFVLVSLMLLNMINGVIVSTFSQIREESNFKEEDISNKCFICNIDKVIFERLKIQFSEHLKFEHNVKNYIRFLVILKLSNYKDLDADQSYVFDCIYNKEIKCFPVGRSLSTGEIDEEKESEDDKD